MWPFKKRVQEIAEVETRASGTGYTAMMMASRAEYITGRDGAAELTSAVQSCVSLWEAGFAMASVDGTDLLTRRLRAVMARQLALRGEAVFYVTGNAMVPVSDWDLQTRLGRPTAYRLTLPDIGGGQTITALAPEVVHVVTGADARQPWAGTPPLRRSGLSAGLLQTMETLLSEVYSDAPIGSQVVPFPEAPEVDMDDLARKFRGYRGKVQVRESVAVTAAGGPAPQSDWTPRDMTPDLQKTGALSAHGQARDAVLCAFGVLPALVYGTAQGPLVREAQRHLARWTLQPLAELVAEELTEKLGTPIKMDAVQPLQAWDIGGQARAVTALVAALSAAKEAGIDADQALALTGLDSE